MHRSLNDTDRDRSTPKTSMSCCFSINIPPGLLFIHQHMVISMIANIANRALVFTYISQVIGNHLTSTSLSMAKHMFNPRPTQGSSIFLDKVVLCIKWFQSTLITNASNIKNSSDICKNIGGLECFGACLSERKQAYALGTLVILLGLALHFLELVTTVSPGLLPPLPRIPATLSLPAILYA